MLELFHPTVRAFFEEEIGQPTEIQRLAWPRIAAGEHVLAVAPTGSGKTLTAFLWALDRLLTGAWTPERTRVLYISPLKALGSDVRRNLEGPLAALRGRFEKAGLTPPAIRAVTRSGDTSQSERRRMLRQPPEILITTPESLNILLTSRGGREILGDLETVILDEIHAVAGTKRGTHLLTAVERLVPLSGEFQRVALSATVRPLERIAELVGGYSLEGWPGEPRYTRRPVVVLRSQERKEYALSVAVPAGAAKATERAAEGAAEGRPIEPADAPWEVLAHDFKRRIRANRSTLFFANSRRLTERVTRLINLGEGEDLAYSHHGSLSREVRSVVEERLKKGQLPAIVATNSLELGIDIGALDEVVLIQTPSSVSSAAQRIGRAGHGVGEVSRARLYPTYGRDFLDAAVVARAVVDGEIEEIHPVVAPLDVLGQVVLSMVVAATDADGGLGIEELWARLRTSVPYHDLPRRQFDLVLEMLAGRYADTRIRELHPRLHVDRVLGRVRARPGVARLLYMAGGTIADRGYYTLRLEGSMARLGELDEEFVWERSLGDSFTLGAQSWQIRRITHNDVIVAPARRSSAMAPFWRADNLDRDHFLSAKIAAFLGRAEAELGNGKGSEGDGGLIERLTRDHFLEPAAAEALREFLLLQIAATGVLPHRQRLVVERVSGAAEGGPASGQGAKMRLVIHNFWGGTVNRPWAMALQAAWEERWDESVDVVSDDDCLMLLVPRQVETEEILGLVDPEQIETLLRRRLERTGFFGARFRLAAGTALLLPRAGFRHRTPLWLNRQRAKKLLESVRRYGDFPVVVETWRGCLNDDFELGVLRRQLRALEAGEIEVAEARTSAPSPFAAGLVWQLTNRHMYDDDTPEGGSGAPGVRPDLLREVVFSAEMRPRLEAVLVESFRRKVQRTSPGYAPRDAEELRAWVGERLLIRESEWQELLSAMVSDAAERGEEMRVEELVENLAQRAVWVRLPGAEERAVVDIERLVFTLGGSPGKELGALDDPDAPPSAWVRAALDALEGEEASSEFLAATPELRALWQDAQGTAPTPRPVLEGEAEGRIERAAQVVAEVLRFDGPMKLERVYTLLGDFGDLDDALALLLEERRAVRDLLTRGAEEAEICDAENLEILLRWLRRQSRPSFEALSLAKLPLFLAWHQGVASRGDGIEALQASLEKLLGYGLPAAAWERQVLPARLDPYYPAWLDALMQESELLWVGCGKERVTFSFPADLELLHEPAKVDSPQGTRAPQGTEAPDREAGAGVADLALSSVAENLVPLEGQARSLEEIATASGRSLAELSDGLWELAWASRATNDTFAALRRGIATGYAAPQPEPRANARRGRRGADRWRPSKPQLGRWRRLEVASGSRDALENEEIAKDRARQLLARYGVLFRELLARELPAFGWSRIFRALRLMELSGEVLAGRFFDGVPGLQFMAPAVFRDLRRGLPEDAVYWHGAADPASCCGLDLPDLKADLPPRQRTTHVVYHGARLVLAARRGGRDLEIRLGAEHPMLGACFVGLKAMLTREVEPRASILVERINGETTNEEQGYVAALSEVFRVVREPKGLRLWKRY